jgi:hypothetical protein
VTLALLLGAALAVACVLLVALPFLREPEPETDVLDEPDALRRRQLQLAEERDRALAALKELELDHRTGKVSDEDYRALVGPLRRRAAETLRALDAYAGRMSEPPDEVPRPAVVPEPTPVPHEPVEPAVVPEPVPPPDEGDRPVQPDVPEPTPR